MFDFLCMIILLRVLAVSSAFLTSSLAQADLPAVKVGALKFGTVNSELNVVKHHTLDTANGIDLDFAPFAKDDACKVLPQVGGVDIIVSD